MLRSCPLTRRSQTPSFLCVSRGLFILYKLVQGPAGCSGPRDKKTSLCGKPFHAWLSPSQAQCRHTQSRLVRDLVAGTGRAPDQTEGPLPPYQVATWRTLEEHLNHFTYYEYITVVYYNWVPVPRLSVLF